MSYCRFGESDVCVYPTAGGIMCCACSLTNDFRGFLAEDAGEMLAHLALHQEAENYVPEYALSRLREEMAMDDGLTPSELARITGMVRFSCVKEPTDVNK